MNPDVRAVVAAEMRDIALAMSESGYVVRADDLYEWASALESASQSDADRADAAADEADDYAGALERWPYPSPSDRDDAHALRRAAKALRFRAAAQRALPDPPKEATR